MKKISIIMALCVILSVFVYNTADAGAFQWLKVGKLHVKVWDNGHESQANGNDFASYYFYHAYRNWHRGSSLRMGARDFTDQNGVYWPVKLAGMAHDVADEVVNMFPREDAEFLTFRRYTRYALPTIKVDGFFMNDPFPQAGDEVAPDKILGTADMMFESHIGTWMGVDIHQRVLVWSQRNHDDYAIYDMTLTNTGNVDRDEEIELPDNTLLDFYFLREAQFFVNREEVEWMTWDGCRPGEPLRIMYSYPARQSGHSWDRFGGAREWGCLRGPIFGGEVVVNVPTSVDNPTNDQSKPNVHYVRGPDDLAFSHSSETKGPSDHILVYDVMQQGYNVVRGTPYMEGTYPGTLHDMPHDERGGKFLDDDDWWFWHEVVGNSSGPYPEIKIGESLRFVWAYVGGSISPEMAWIKGGEWINGTIEPPEGNVLGVSDNLPKQYKNHPDLYATDALASEYYNWAKDCWIMTGKDSLFQNGINAVKNFQNDYNVPTGPPPPSIEVNSKPDKIEINWGSESETASDFAGYRVFRAEGRPGLNYNIYYDREYHPEYSWKMIFECGDGTANALTHSHADATADRAKAYFYYVIAFDDGIGNIADVNGKIESLESGESLNMTTRAAYLTRAPGAKLSDIRVVPNPFNIGAEELQYPGEELKIMFLDVPGYCTIKIYSESGDLVQTLEHTDGSGDQSWGDIGDEHLVTETGQVIVSGIYIAVIEENNADGTSTGNTHFVKFVIVR